MTRKKKKGFLIIAHGSRKKEANQRIYDLIDKLAGYYQDEIFEPAFMELASPSIDEGIKVLAGKGIEELVVFPFFLFKGMHFSNDVPNLIQSSLDSLDRKIPLKILEPIGMHNQLFNMVQEMLYEEVMDQQTIKPVDPTKIEDLSMEIIENNFGENHIPLEQKPIIKRVIHTTGDFDFLSSMIFRNGAIPQGLKALREKKIIYSDVTMVQAGINKKFGHEVKCILNDPEVTAKAKEEGTTRVAAGIKSLDGALNGNIVVIGNAPTALATLVDMVNENKVKPALIVGTPVGFVNAKESKAYLTTLSDIPFITNRGQKGGSAVAAAIINALIKMEFENKEVTITKG
jgi:precorrin-8X/cobalt-precorrin-8 methylmutase